MMTLIETTKLRKNDKLATAGVPAQGQPFNIQAYFKGVRQEWTRITWPSRPQVIAETAIVIVVVALFTIFVFSVDHIFQFLIHLIT